MAVYDLWHKQSGGEPCSCGTRKRPLYPSSRHGQGLRWQVRWRNLEGKQRNKNFPLKVGQDPGRHADAFDAQVSRDVDTGNYTDPKLAETSFAAYAGQWRAGRGHDPERAAYVERMLRNHALEGKPGSERTPMGGVSIGQHSLGLLARRPSLSQGWIQAMPLAPASKRQVVEIVSAVYRAAIDDGIIGRDPTKASSVDRPSPGSTKARPWPRERVAAMREALPPRFAVIPALLAATGMRQGEMFGLAVDDVRFLGKRPVVSIARQVKMVGGKPCFGPLKNRKPHQVPLAPSLAAELARHIGLYPPREVTLPWHDPRDKERHGKQITARLIVTRPDGRALERGSFDEHVWRRALLRAGIIAGERGPARQDGCHALRHTFVSVQLRARIDIVRVAAWIGDTPQTVARVYAHLLPDDDDSDGRAAVDAFLAPCDPDVIPAEEPGTLWLAGNGCSHSHLECRPAGRRRRPGARVFGSLPVACRFGLSASISFYRLLYSSCDPGVIPRSTNAPLPCTTLTRPRSVSSCIARRTVISAAPYSAASSARDGSRSPCAQRPALTCRSMSSAMRM